MNKLSLLGVSALSLLAAPLVSFAQSGWTSPCSAGATIDETSLGLYQVNNASLLFRTAKTGSVVARYDVTNTAVPSVPNPPWMTMELGYFDPGPNASVIATLFSVAPCTGQIAPICQIISVDSPNPTCLTCNFPNTTFNFLTTLYYVQVTVTRTSADTGVQANTLRIF